MNAGAGPLVDVRELRMMGDAGPRPPALDLLVKPGLEDRAGAQLAKVIVDLGKAWDVIDLEPLAGREAPHGRRARRRRDRRREGRRRRHFFGAEGALAVTWRMVSEKPFSSK